MDGWMDEWRAATPASSTHARTYRVQHKINKILHVSCFAFCCVLLLRRPVSWSLVLPALSGRRVSLIVSSCRAAVTRSRVASCRRQSLDQQLRARLRVRVFDDVEYWRPFVRLRVERRVAAQHVDSRLVPKPSASQQVEKWGVCRGQLPRGVLSVSYTHLTLPTIYSV